MALNTAAITTAFKQAPWRVQTQMVAGAAVFVVMMAVIGAMYLATAARAATAGRDVQRLEAERLDLIRQNEDLRAQIAQAKSLSRLEARARELDFAPAANDQVQYLIVPGYGNTDDPVSAGTAHAPSYDETLGAWLGRAWASLTAGGG